MKIKFEIKLTASRALLAVMAGLIGMQPSVASEDKTEKPVFEPIPPKGEPVPAEQLAEVKPAEGPVVPEVPKRKRNTQKPAEQPAPEKIIAPEPEKEAEAEIPEPETETTEDPSIDEGSNFTIDDIRNSAGKLIQGDPTLRDKVFAILKKHGASKISEVKPEHFASVLEELKKVK